MVAFIVPASDSRPDPSALDARCLASIARYKRPRQYLVVDALPRNAAGKVLKTELRDRVALAEEDTPR